MMHLVLAISQNAKFHLGVLRTFQPVHGLFVGDLLAYKYRVVDLNNLVTCQDTCPLCRAIANHILHTDGILADGELDADAGERTPQIIVGNLAVAGRDIDRMRIELAQDLRHCLLYQIIDIHRIHILVVDDVKQVVELIAAGIDDIQSVS